MSVFLFYFFFHHCWHRCSLAKWKDSCGVWFPTSFKHFWLTAAGWYFLPVTGRHHELICLHVACYELSAADHMATLGLIGFGCTTAWFSYQPLNGHCCVIQWWRVTYYPTQEQFRCPSLLLYIHFMLFNAFTQLRLTAGLTLWIKTYHKTII